MDKIYTGITIEEIRKIKGMENLQAEEANMLIDSIKEFALLIKMHGQVDQDSGK